MNLSEELGVSIKAIDSVSALGTADQCWKSFCDEAHRLSPKDLSDQVVWAGIIPDKLSDEIQALRQQQVAYSKLDNTVLQAIWLGRQLIRDAGWEGMHDFGINIGSSRGATSLFEKYHEEYLSNKSVPNLTSPTTTLGNISSWVAQDLSSQGPEISHSITCSTSLHALLNGVAWLKAGLADRFLVGGSEAPVTPFTVAQMQALKIYSRGGEPYPCRALDLRKRNNGMVLGEGSAMACLEKGVDQNSLAIIRGIGYATESLDHPVSFSAQGDCLQRSMAMACEGLDKDDIDAIVMHAPGTIKGDKSEYSAIQHLFRDKLPALTANKWKIGHTLGASGMLSVHMAVLMLQNQSFIDVPYLETNDQPEKLDNILVNAVGFGGNAVSVVLGRIQS